MHHLSHHLHPQVMYHLSHHLHPQVMYRPSLQAVYRHRLQVVHPPMYLHPTPNVVKRQAISI